ncbi:MAG: arginase family protein [Candidatus Aenigmarchaeota archaeon]|nr:arginase family protein [Candidatus Aenigmarchaeota archaeon]
MDFSLLGLGYDKTQTFRRGSILGPEMIKTAFGKLETNISGVDLNEKAFFHDLGVFYPKDSIELSAIVQNKLSETKKFPIILGGEHSITFPCVKAVKPRTFLSLDAHPDCEDGEGHNAVFRKVTEFLGAKNCFLHGVRTISKKEGNFIKNNKIKILSASAVKNLPGPIYLSIDFDCLDPSVLPAVGNPEPEGLGFNELISIVKSLAGKLCAIDFVEFTPIGVAGLDELYSSIAGKAVYGAIAEIVKVRK